MNRIFVIVVLIFGIVAMFALPKQVHAGVDTAYAAEQSVAFQEAAPHALQSAACPDEHFSACHALVLTPDTNALSAGRAVSRLYADAQTVLDGTIFGREPRPPRL
jgi:hypothetical protein